MSLQIIFNQKKKIQDLFFKWWEKNYPTITDDYFTDRDLYDFFDEQGIKITILFKGLFMKFSYDIKTNDWYCKDLFNTRKEAETEAFTKAFEILNKIGYKGVK